MLPQLSGRRKDNTNAGERLFHASPGFYRVGTILFCGGPAGIGQIFVRSCVLLCVAVREVHCESINLEVQTNAKRAGSLKRVKKIDPGYCIKFCWESEKYTGSVLLLRWTN